MQKGEQIVSLKPAPFFPSISLSGEEPRFLIAGENVWLKSKGAGVMYAVAYRGSYDIGETIAAKQLTGTVAYDAGDTVLRGQGTQFLTELRVGQFCVTDDIPSEFFVVEEVVDDETVIASRPFEKTNVSTDCYVLPVLYALGQKRATQIRGNAVRFPKGHYLAVGDGELRLNDQPIGTAFNLSTIPKYALYDPNNDDYEYQDFGISLPTGFSFTLATSPNNGVKNMLSGKFGVRLVAKSTKTGGYSNPSENVSLSSAHTAGRMLRITFNTAMNTAAGQDAYDIYVTKYESSSANADNAVLGPWYWVKEVTAAELAIENSVPDGTVSGLIHDFEFADGELEASDRILTFDNFEPIDCEFVDLAGSTPVFFSAEGRATTAKGRGISPGASIVPGKPDNPEAVMLNNTVKTFEGDSIIGVLNVRGRWWLLCENSLQAAILTGIDAAPITCRSYWDVGFRNPYNLKFIKDYIFGFSTLGFLRSIGVGDESQVDFDFSVPVDDYATDWLCSHVITAYDPKNKAICFFFAGKEKRNGYWVTVVLPYLPHQNIWNPPIVLSREDGDFIVSGAATIGQKLYFIAGGRSLLGTFEASTYEFDRPASGVDVNAFVAWAFTDNGMEDQPVSIAGVASVIGDFNNAKVEIHGIDAQDSFDLAALQAGHNKSQFTIDIGTTNGKGRIREKRQTVPPLSKWTARFSFQAKNGEGRLDELNLLVKANASRK